MSEADPSLFPACEPDGPAVAPRRRQASPKGPPLTPLEQWARIQAMYAEARANGTHSDRSQHICGGCRELVEFIWYQTPARVQLCGTCADKFGQGPDGMKALRRTNGQG